MVFESIYIYIYDDEQNDTPKDYCIHSYLTKGLRNFYGDFSVLISNLLKRNKDFPKEELVNILLKNPDFDFSLAGYQRYNPKEPIVFFNYYGSVKFNEEYIDMTFSTVKNNFWEITQQERILRK